MPRDSSDADWVRTTLEDRWGDVQIITQGQAHDASQLPALIAMRGPERCGLLTYRPSSSEAEIVTLDALVPSIGVGSRLIEAVTSLCQTRGWDRVWLITTNDNLTALRFYQRRGLRISAIYPDGVPRARDLKRSIPHVGEMGIPVMDEEPIAAVSHRG